MKAILRYTLIAALLGVIGCTSADSDKGRFDRIAKDLDAGGSTFFISSSRNAGTAFEKIIKHHERFVWGSDLPKDAQFKFQHFISCSELAARIAGLHEIKGWGGSSKQLAGAKKVLFRNKFRLLLPKNCDGILWNLFSSRNHSLANYLVNLPADTFFAGALDLNPATLEHFLKADKKLVNSVTGVCKLLLDMSVRETLDALSGVWQVIIVCDEQNDTESLTGIHIALNLPDKEGKIFKALASKLAHMPYSVIDLKAGTIKLDKLPGKSCIPYIRRGNGTISFYTTPRAAARISDGKSFPQQPAFIRELAELSDLNGIGVFYSSNTGTGKDFTKALDVTTSQPSLAILKKMPDGFIVEDTAACDFNQYAVFSLGVLPLKLLTDSFVTPVPRAPRRKSVKAPQKTVQQSKTPVKRSATKSKAPAVSRRVRSKDCSEAIKLAGKRLLKEAGSSGKWAAPGIAGLRLLVEKKVLSDSMLRCPTVKKSASRTAGLSYANCHYLYFGKPAKDSPKTPLLMEFPFLHRNHFSVFYADGSVEKVHLDGQHNVRRAVSFLHTVHSYDEEEFMRLMQLASEFDKILER